MANNSYADKLKLRMSKQRFYSKLRYHVNATFGYCYCGKVLNNNESRCDDCKMKAKLARNRR